jgi:acetyl-CoA acyltransferase
VTAGNSSQMSDGAAFVLIMSEEMVKELNLEPIARLVNFASAGVEPRIMEWTRKSDTKSVEASWFNHQ